MKIIKEKLENNPFLIAVHRGSSMGNIVENTIPAFRLQFNQAQIF